MTDSARPTETLADEIPPAERCSFCDGTGAVKSPTKTKECPDGVYTWCGYCSGTGRAI